MVGCDGRMRVQLHCCLVAVIYAILAAPAVRHTMGLSNLAPYAPYLTPPDLPLRAIDEDAFLSQVEAVCGQAVSEYAMRQDTGH